MSMKVPGSAEEYHYLGHGYDATTGDFIKVQLFNQKPDASYEEPTAKVNRHPTTTLYYEDQNSTRSINSQMDIEG